MERNMEEQTLPSVDSNNTHELQLISDAIKDSSNIIVITGAGISKNAGIPVNLRVCGI
jgi:accessory colonization factor AcfC